MNEELVRDVNASPYMACVAVTGGGVSFIDEFLSFGGGSKTILSFEVPYKEEFLQELIGCKPDKYVSPDTARKMAMASYRKACKVQDPLYAVGVGCTASLITPNEREGRKHRVSIAIQTASACRTLNAVFAPFKFKQIPWTREDQEWSVREWIMLLLAERTVGAKINFNSASDIADIQTSLVDLGDNQEWIDFFTGKTDLYVNGPKAKELLAQDHTVIFSGSFNPLHAGHMEMHSRAKEITGITPVFEISVQNVDKPELNLWDIYQRHDALVDFPLVLTRAPFFTQKSQAIKEAFPASKTINGFDKRIDYVVGLDTWERFTTYPDRHELRHHRAFHENVGFVIFNRGGKQIDEFNHNFKHVTFIHGFDNPLSSTQLRLATNEK